MNKKLKNKIEEILIIIFALSILFSLAFINFWADAWFTKFKLDWITG